MNAGWNRGRKAARGLAAALLALAICLPGATPALGAESARYTDVAAGQWFAEAADYCYDMGLILGTGDGKFSPQLTMSRAMLVTILWRMEYAPRPASPMIFSDNLDWDAWYFQAVNWAAENGVASGYGGGTFGVNDPVTREQFAAILFNYAVYKNPELAPAAEEEPSAEAGGDLTAEEDPLAEEEEDGAAEDPADQPDEADFADADQIAPYARYAVAWAKEQRILSGKPGGLFDPQGQTTRAEAAVLIRNFLLPLEQRVEPVDPEPVDPEDPLAFTLTVGGQVFQGVLAENEAAEALRERMPFTVEMRDRNGREKWYDLTFTLPVDASLPDQLAAGDLMLYRNNGLVLFYQGGDPYYRYTPLGKIQDAAGLAQALSGEKVKVTFQTGAAPAPEPSPQAEE